VKRNETFNIVKHVKRASRLAIKAPKGQVVRSKKKDLLQKISEREARDLG
jgi:hypothetical protein